MFSFRLSLIMTVSSRLFLFILSISSKCFLLNLTFSSKLFSPNLSISSSFYFIYKHKKQHDYSPLSRNKSCRLIFYLICVIILIILCPRHSNLLWCYFLFNGVYFKEWKVCNTLQGEIYVRKYRCFDENKNIFGKNLYMDIIFNYYRD